MYFPPIVESIVSTFGITNLWGFFLGMVAMAFVWGGLIWWEKRR